MDYGYIKLHRKLLDWEWYTDANVYRLFTHLLMKANYKDKKWRGIEIKRGQLLTSSETLSEELHLSRQQIRTAITKLISTNEITSKTTSRNTVITIVSYDLYQQDNQQDNQQITNNQPTDNQQITTTNKDNKDNKEEEVVDKIKIVTKKYQQNIEVIQSQLLQQKIIGWCEEYTEVQILYAIDEAVMNSKRNAKYIEAILRSGAKPRNVNKNPQLIINNDELDKIREQNALSTTRL